MRIPKTVATANFNCHKINIQNHTQIYTYTYVNFNNNYELLMLDFINKQISLMIIAVRVYICFLCKKYNKPSTRMVK